MLNLGLFIIALTLLVCNKQMAMAAYQTNKKLYGFQNNLWEYRIPIILGSLLIFTLLFFDIFIWNESS